MASGLQSALMLERRACSSNFEGLSALVPSIVQERMVRRFSLDEIPFLFGTFLSQQTNGAEIIYN